MAARRRRSEGDGWALILLGLVVAAIVATAFAIWTLLLVTAVIYDTVRIAWRARAGKDSVGFETVARVWTGVTSRLAAHWGQRTLRVEELSELRALTPSEFEDAVATILRDTGFKNVRRVGGAGDLNVDITAKSDTGKSVAVQCKRWQARIGSREIQTFIGMVKIHHRADLGIFVTTSDYTKAAQALAEEHADIQLWDGVMLSELLARRRGKLPSGKRAQPEKALRRSGASPEVVIARARLYRDLPPPSDGGPDCQCRSDNVEWVGFQDDDLVNHLICPSCHRFATQEEVEATFAQNQAREMRPWHGD